METLACRRLVHILCEHPGHRQRSGRTTRPEAEVDPDSNDAGSGNSEHAGDADAESSAREAARDGACTLSAATTGGAAADATATLQDGAEHATLPGEVLPPTAASTSAAATATAAKEKTTENAMGLVVTDARATLLLPLGNLVVVEVEGCSGHGVAGTASCAFTGNSGSGDYGDDPGVPAGASGEATWRLVRLDDRVEIVHCRGESSLPGAKIVGCKVCFCSRFCLTHRHDFDSTTSNQFVGALYYVVISASAIRYASRSSSFRFESKTYCFCLTQTRDAQGLIVLDTVCPHFQGPGTLEKRRSIAWRRKGSYLTIRPKLTGAHTRCVRFRTTSYYVMLLLALFNGFTHPATYVGVQGIRLPIKMILNNARGLPWMLFVI